MSFNISELIPSGSAGENLIVVLAALAAFVNVLIFYRALLVRDPLGHRVKQLAQRREALKAGITAAPRRERRRESGMSFMKRMVNALKLTGTRQSDKATRLLSQAGWRSKDTIIVYLFLKVCLPIAFGLAAVLVLYVFKLKTVSPTMGLIICAAAVIIGAYGPDLYIRNAVTKRKKLLQKGLPDALDLLVICTEAGQALDSALDRVAREMAKSCPPISDELSLTALEMGLLPDRRQALDNLNNRTDMPGIRGIVNTLMQTEKYGTPLAQSLRVLSAEFRTERLMKAEEKAARLPAIMTVPMIIFILPPLFIVLIGPAIIKTVDLLGRM